MATFNPKTKNLIVLLVKIRSTQETISYLFPLNPASLSTNQASRVSATFTYGDKVFQNLGAGLKTLSIEGHTGYKLDRLKYGLQEGKSDIFVGGDQTGNLHWLDLYALIQLIKGENKYISKHSKTITPKFSVDNIDEIETVQITIPDQGITYDVLLQNDNFLRNREQPHLYKYKLDFIVVQESLGFATASPVVSRIPDKTTLVDQCKRLSDTLKNIKDTVKNAIPSFPGARAAYDAMNNGLTYAESAITAGNFFITQANSTINDIRRLERMTNAINDVAANIGLIRGIVQQIQSFTDLRTAFYEPYIALKHLKVQLTQLQKSMVGDQQSLAFNVNMTRLASISAPVTLAANKATVAQFQKDIRQLNRISFPFPIDRVEEITIDGITKINVFFKTRPSALGISDIQIFAANDFGNENNLVESLSDSKFIMSTNYNTSGYIYNFIIEYNYASFESIVQPRYKSIKRVLIANGETLESIIKRYAAKEANASQSYMSEVAYLNQIEYPYVVTSDNPNFEAYFGSYGFKIFTDKDEFTKYIYNINTSTFPGVDFTLYDWSNTLDPNYINLDDPVLFLIQQSDVIDQIKTGSKFFVLLFKETYSNRCYALFGITNSASCSLFTADSYVICALEKGRSYDVENNSIFEILSPYTITGDLIEFYGQTAAFDLLTETYPTMDLFDKTSDIINNIYVENIGSFTDGHYPYTNYDVLAPDLTEESQRFISQKTFLAGDEDNKNYVILTNFTAGTIADEGYAISAFSIYKILADGQEILLPSFENTFLPFAEAFTKEDTYKVDLDIRFQYFDDINVSILPRPDLGPGPSGEEQGYLDFKLISGLENVKQALRDRLECPQGGLILHRDYGLPNLLGKKNTLEHLILLRYNLFSQLMSDNRVRSIDDMKIEDAADAIKADSHITLVNNDETLIKTTL